MEIKNVILKYKKFILPASLAAAALILLLFSQKTEDEPQKTELTSALLSEELEEKIESLCKSVDGVRYAKALVTLDTSEEYVLAKDSEKNGDAVKIETVGAENGGIELYVISPRVRGVAVVCTGGDRAGMKKTVIELLSAALGIDSTKIGVAGS